ncbi:MAG: GTPase [Acetobacteraceae bacterium]|nr:GTPase [Acetobacteraceae bacterium]
MRLRVFHARTASLALEQVRDALGEEAVVLSTRRVAGGVEVTAAQDGAEEPLLIPPEPVAPPALPPALARHNLPPALALALTMGDAGARLAEVLRFEALPEGRPWLLVGPPGAGKTLSCAKLAAREAMRGRLPVVVTCDGARAGAVEQLAAFTRLLRLTLAVAATPEALRKAVTGAEPGQAVVVDGFGCDPFEPVQARRLHALIAASGAAPVLVLPAGLDADEAAEQARAFHALGARHLLPTRLDAARRLGGVLAAAATGLALAEAGTGPGVADGLSPLTAAELARRLLGSPA